MRTLSVNAGTAEIKNLVAEWLELLAQEKYVEALELILYDNTQVVDATLWTWTPQNLEADVFKYDVLYFDDAVTDEMAKTWGIEKLDYKNIIGDVICDCVLLDGELSDLSALFWIQKTDDENMTLIFRDLHVM